jgi:hypothetical protein
MPTWHFVMAFLIFSTLTSLMPLILLSVLRVAPWTDFCDLQLEALVRRSTWVCGIAAYSDRVEAISFKLRDICSIDPSMKMLAVDGELIVLGYDHHEPECCRCRE